MLAVLADGLFSTSRCELRPSALRLVFDRLRKAVQPDGAVKEVVVFERGG